MTEYQASNIAVEDTENSTLIEPCILPLKKVWVGMENLAERSGPKRPTQGIFNVHGVWHFPCTGTHYGPRSGFPIFYNCLYSLTCSRPEYS
jgi:hypothetical protein